MLMVVKESEEKDAQTFISTKTRAEVNVEDETERRENAKPQRRMFVVMHFSLSTHPILH